MRTQGAKTPPSRTPVADSIENANQALAKIEATRDQWRKIHVHVADEWKHRFDIFVEKGFSREEAMQLVVALIRA